MDKNKNKFVGTSGFLPPQAVEAEEAVLGALMLDSNSYHKIATWIKPESFYIPHNAEIYGIIQSLHDNRMPVDIISVIQKLTDAKKLDQIGGAYYITQLTDRVVSGGNIESHALFIQQKFLEREMIAVCSDYIQKVYMQEGDIFTMYDDLSNDLFQKVAVNAGKEAVVISDIIRKRIEVYEQPVEEGLTGLTSGFKSVDAITGGWQPSDLIILAARPGMGKTAFALNIARHAAVSGGKPGAIFSLEMSKEQLVDRMVSAETEVYLEKIRHRKLSEYDIRKITFMTALINSKIFIDDSASLSIQAFRSKAIRLKHKHNIGFIVIDYLQLMRGENPKNGNREQEISSISRGLKAVAKELDIPVIALSQLSRAVENRPASSRKPMLSDLRESGAIEQDADQVMFLFRPEYYDIEEDENGNSTKGKCQVDFAKNRNGALNAAVLDFNGAYMKFSEPQDPDFPQSAKTLAPNINFDNPDDGPF